MTILLWRDDFSVGIGSIDVQHKTLINLINELHNAMTQGTSKEILGETLKQLANYTEIHFAFEEKLMKDTAYPGYWNHKKEHDDFVKEINSIQMKFVEGSIGLSVSLMNILRDWLTDHIMGTDQKYTPHFAQKGIK
jgi:hemerythrin